MDRLTPHMPKATLSVAAVCLLISVALVAPACGKKREVAPPDNREAIAIMYVATPEIEIHQQASKTSKVIATYRQGESISLLAVNGTWAEIRTVDGSGWADQSALSREKASGAFLPDDTSVRFIREPRAVASNSRQPGEIVLEAFVNTAGEVVDVTIVKNTTGSAELERRNREELKSATFQPMIQQGRPRTFIYTHRVSY